MEIVSVEDLENFSTGERCNLNEEDKAYEKLVKKPSHTNLRTYIKTSKFSRKYFNLLKM